jgi:multiple antibiotic resistance protein
MNESVTSFVGATVIAFGALVPLVNPPGLAPIFLSMTRGVSDVARTTIARRIARASFLLLLAAMLVGSYVLMLFGLSLAVVKIAGGLLVIATAWHLVSAEQSPDTAMASTSPVTPLDGTSSSTFYPLTFPLTVGPGSISVAVTLGVSIRNGDVAPLTAVLGCTIGIVLVSAAIYLSYRFAARLVRALGGTGTVIVMRLSAFILLAVGVQILCDGLVERFAVLNPSSH